jgi:hypothetical protein
MTRFENPPANDQSMIDAIVDFQINLMKQSDPTVRGQHPKINGCLRGEFRVLDNLEPDIAHGVFAEPRTYPAWIRLSNAFGADDRQPDFHGLAIKLMGVPGEKIGNEQQTQDFLLLDAPYFFTGTVEALLKFMQQKVGLMVQGKTPQEQLQALSVDFPNEVERFVKTVRPAPAPPTASRYWSCAPSLLGDQAVKYMLEPQGFDSDAAGKPEPSVERDSQNYARESLVASLAPGSKPTVLNFSIQKQENPDSEPVEDASVEWKTRFTRVAELTIAPQKLDTNEQDQFGQNLSFNPWHSLPEHQPIGGLNRARKIAYVKSSELRHTTDGVPLFEPRPNDKP